jgi:hypothetical protein
VAAEEMEGFSDNLPEGKVSCGFPDPMSGSCVSRTCIPGKQEREPSERSASADWAIWCSPCGEATGCGGDKPGSRPRLPFEPKVGYGWKPASALSDAPSWIPDIRFTAGVGRKLSGCFLRD